MGNWPINRRAIVVRVAVAILCSIGLIACGGGQFLAPAPDVADIPQQPGTGALPDLTIPDDIAAPEDPEAPRVANVLKVETPRLADMNPGREFDVILSGEFIEEVYQGSCRLVFDPAVMQPEEVRRGGLLNSSMLHIATVDQPGYIPFSFTALPGDRGIVSGSGELLRVRFRLLGQATGTERVRLLSDGEYLQLRDRNGRRLRFDTLISGDGR